MNAAAGDLVRRDCELVLEKGIECLGGIGDSNVLITGGTGFMGSWIAEMLCCLNDSKLAGGKIYLLGRDAGRFERNLGHLTGRSFLEFIRCDVRNIIEIPKDVNFIIHAAGTPDSRVHATNPIETMVGIAEGTHSILKAADRVSNLRMFVNVSSSSVYGTQPMDLQGILEEYSGIAVNSQVSAAYSEAKRYGEALVNAARTEARIPTVIARPFTFAGAYQPLDAPWAVNNFIKDALSRRPIRILGDGQTIRSVMYGADMALWMLTIMTRGMNGQVYNVGSDEAISVERIAEIVARNFNPAPTVQLNASLFGKVANTRLVPNTDMAKRTFGLTTHFDVNAALRNAIAWYRASV
jgi:nucleoside-diphosphate-sugar epimerase